MRPYHHLTFVIMRTSIRDSDRIDELVEEACSPTPPLEDSDTLGADMIWEEFDQES